MIFGNAQRLTQVKCPDTGLDMSPALWSVSAPYLNGGLHVRRSDATHMTYALTWTNIGHRDQQDLSDFYHRVYGPPPYYFVLPGTHGNVLPQSWATPSLAATDGTSMLRHHRPRLMAMPDTNRYPTASAYYTVEAEDVRNTVTVPVPEGMVAGIGWHGSSTGDTAVVYSMNGGPMIPLVPMSRTPGPTNTEVAGPGLLTLEIGPGSGTCTVNALVVQLRKPGQQPTSDGFVSGQGHSGVEIVNMTNRLESAAHDQRALTLEMQEVQQWR